MKIVLLLNQPYPNGFALTKRIHLYAKGFQKNGHDCKIIVPLPLKDNGFLDNKTIKGIFDEVSFEYTVKNTISSKFFIIRRLRNFIGTLKAGMLCIKGNPDIVITTSFSFYFLIYIKIISKICSFKFIRETNEISYMRDDKISLKKRIISKCRYGLFDGFIVISKQLSNYLTDEVKNSNKSIIVPILVNDYKKKSLPIQKTIVYTGTYYERKDGIITILNAFAKLNESYPDYKLLLTGSPKRSKDYKKILESIRKNRLKKHIVFTGYLSEEALQNVLISSTMLILAKPANRQNLYNFPTKLGEYLISGRPVITTKIGVVGEIFENNKNIIYAENSVQDISDKMQFVIRHQDLADKVGEMGRKYAIENFNYLKHSRQMSNYFKSLY